MVVTAVFLAFTAWRLWPRNAGDSGDGHRQPEADAAVSDALGPAMNPGNAEGDASPITFGLVGAAAGGLSGLLGIGGGILMVPGFTEIVGMPIKRAIATSLVCVGVFAIPGTVTHALLGDVDWRFAFWLAVGVVPGARLGATLAIRAADDRLQSVVAVFLGTIAVGYGIAEVIAAL
jgi:uncharacterized membrane protein YfcA